MISLLLSRVVDGCSGYERVAFRVDDVFAKCLVVHLRSLRYKKSIGSEKNWPIKMARRGKSVEDGFPFSLFDRDLCALGTK